MFATNTPKKYQILWPSCDLSSSSSEAHLCRKYHPIEARKTLYTTWFILLGNTHPCNGIIIIQSLDKKRKIQSTYESTKKKHGFFVSLQDIPVCCLVNLQLFLFKGHLGRPLTAPSPHGRIDVFPHHPSDWHLELPQLFGPLERRCFFLPWNATKEQKINLI